MANRRRKRLNNRRRNIINPWGPPSFIRTPGKTRGCPKSNKNCNLGGMTWVTLTTAWDLQSQNNYLSTWGSGVY